MKAQMIPRMIRHIDISKTELQTLIRNKEIVLAGNMKLRIYGSLRCSSGKRMKKQNRVFFNSISEAIGSGYRPCGHCLRKEYKEWVRSK